MKLAVGRSEQTKSLIAEAIAQALMSSADCDEASISMSIEDVDPRNWVEKVYKPEIAARWDQLYKKPGYDPLWPQAWPPKQED